MLLQMLQLISTSFALRLSHRTKARHLLSPVGLAMHLSLADTGYTSGVFTKFFAVHYFFGIPSMLGNDWRSDD